MKQKKCVICGTLHKNKSVCSIKCRSKLDSITKSGVKNPAHSKTMKEKYRNGYKNWNAGLTKETDERVKKLSESQTGIKKDFSNYRGKKHHFWGTKHKEATKQKMSKAHKGENHWNWQNGKTELVMQIRNSPEYAEWRLKVYTRDNFTCKKCGCNKSGELEAHHIKFLFVIIKEYQIKTLDDALKCKELWEVKNGLTLCKDCHHKIKHIL